MNCCKDSGYRYESVFAHASFQFCGHIDEYLISNTRHLTLVRFQTRFGSGGHLLERYEEGRLVEERKLRSAKNIFLYYLLWSFHHNRELWRHSHRLKCMTVVLFTHPVGCFGMGLQRLFGHVKFAFWPWDWFPPTSLPLKIYAAVVRFYAKRSDFTYALTNAIAAKIGGNAVVVMLGMKRLPCADADRSRSRHILVVGQLRQGQGIEDVLDFIAEHPEYSLTLLGAAAHGFEHVIEERVRINHLEGRVNFPNRFVSQDELSEAAAKCFCGLALYDTSADNFTHYADPGKVKSYLEMGLPVVMTRISGIIPYIEKYEAGEVIDSIADLPAAVSRIVANPHSYSAGVRAISKHFEYEPYYSRTFHADHFDNTAYHFGEGTWSEMLLVDGGGV